MIYRESRLNVIIFPQNDVTLLLTNNYNFPGADTINVFGVFHNRELFGLI